jgi:hypothetical protein
MSEQTPQTIELKWIAQSFDYGTAMDAYDLLTDAMQYAKQGFTEVTVNEELGDQLFVIFSNRELTEEELPEIMKEAMMAMM